MNMTSTSTFRIIALCKDGTDLMVGQGFRQIQAETVRRRLVSWNVFREVFVEAELDGGQLIVDVLERAILVREMRLTEDAHRQPHAVEALGE